MNKVNLAVIGYNSKYNKFLNYIRRKDANYKISYISKLININTIKNFKSILKNNKIKIMIICNHKSVYFVNKNIDFFINNNIKVVQASTNFDIKNHGYIIKKPFKDFSFSQFFIRKILSINKKNLNKILDKKVVLITGGAGYIGSVLVPELLKSNHKVCVYDSLLFGGNGLLPHFKNPNFSFIKGDIRNEELLLKEIPNHDIVIHLACISNDPSFELNPKLGKSINLDAFIPLVEISKKNSIKKNWNQLNH